MVWSPRSSIFWERLKQVCCAHPRPLWQLPRDERSASCVELASGAAGGGLLRASSAAGNGHTQRNRHILAAIVGQESEQPKRP